MKFQDSWVAKVPSAKLCVRSNGNLHTVKCKICSEEKKKDKLLLPKWDFLCKHAGRKKTKKNIRTNVKKGHWYYSEDYKHAKNHKLLLTIMNLLLPKLQMVKLEKRFRKLCKLLLFCTCCHKDISC